MTFWWLMSTKKSKMGRLKPQTDASIWSAIRYLDSATDYREHLASKARPIPPEQGEFVLLDDSSQMPWASLWKLTIIAILIFTVLALYLVN